jgi:pyruvate ferredoxin oxidoreductase gamma subunit
MVDVVWYGRGGQGAFTAARLLGLSVSIYGGASALAFPSFGPERRGAPVFGYTKIDTVPIKDRSEPLKADYCIVLDDTLLSDQSLPLKDGGTLIVNTSRSERIKYSGFHIVTLDASGIALSVFGKPVVNTAMLGAFVASTNILQYNAAVSGIQTEIKKDTDKNILVFAMSYAAVLSGSML